MSTRMLKPYTHITTGAARKAVEVLDQDPMLPASFAEAASAMRRQIAARRIEL